MPARIISKKGTVYMSREQFASKHQILKREECINTREAKPGPITSLATAEQVDGIWIEYNETTGVQRCVGMCASTGVQCRRWSEEGVDRCKWHGGRAVPKISVRTRYKDMHPKMAQRIDQMISDPHWKDMSTEVALVRDMINNRIKQLEHPSLIDEELVLERIEVLRKVLQSISVGEGGLNLNLNIGQVHAFAEQLLRMVCDAAQKYIAEEPIRILLCEGVARDIDQLMLVGSSKTGTGK